jgi:hypothetical protein
MRGRNKPGFIPNAGRPNLRSRLYLATAAGGDIAAGAGVTEAAATFAASEASDVFVAVTASGGVGSGPFKYFTSGLFAISSAITTDCAFNSAPSGLV